MRANLEQIILEHCPDVQGLEQLLDKIEALYHNQEDNSLDARRTAFIEELRPFIEQYGKDVVNKFGNYWLEKSTKGRKFRFEKQPTFNISLRLKTWIANQQKFSIANMMNKGKQVNPLR